MKIFKNIKQVVALLALPLLFNACNDYIEEEFYSGVTSENFLNEDTADQLIVGVYAATRAAYNNHSYRYAGTDVFTVQSEIFSVSSENDYTSFNAPETNGLWTTNYQVIAKANTAINRYENQINWSAGKQTEKAYGIAQARALRAFAYYNLVQQYGGVPLELVEPLSIRNDYTRETEEAIYKVVIEELEAAIPNLIDAPETGRFSKRAAQHLLSEVYLTRAYKTYALATDFQTAANLAVQAIGTYDIRSQSFARVFDYDNQVNPEVLFAAQWDGAIDADRGNNMHSLFMTAVQVLPGMSVINKYGKPGNNLMPTPYFYSLFAANDTREDVTVHRVLYADKTDIVGTDNIVAGDTLVYFPKQALDITKLTDKLNRYWVYQPDQYLYGRPDDIPGVNYLYSKNNLFTNFPIFKKFDDEIFFEEGSGARDAFIFRVAETHLLAAEAFLGAGNATQALFHINRVRERATGVADYYTTINLDAILVERALELAGEENRWAVLKRMGKLEERIELYNPHVIDHGDFDATKHLLRPIPTREIELSPTTMTQNPKY
ncbi:putative outer membrane starch-binding protein [Mariniflexile fucanivorans]|uniref:Putative outer membrane starch-binding protein n=1 Tax=Mariniflexile fucanivorans TaxID=264023 RepID=A0A4R1RKE2_9FLAO|nr:RagB/SusD family nutrient uptake outer membrane protein [Mariniflexile fucanivorans]TCL66280.1 putative outer membrane starch-binding protein [Mariniflexile fucanivorans]